MLEWRSDPCSGVSLGSGVRDKISHGSYLPNAVSLSVFRNAPQQRQLEIPFGVAQHSTQSHQQRLLPFIHNLPLLLLHRESVVSLV